MATLDRPGVEVSQTVTATSPTVLTPTLTPCIVGPCYQIVEPLTSGALNSSAAVLTPAQVVSANTLAEPILLSGLKLKIAVDGGDPQNITLPATIGSVGISFALAKKSIQAQLTGATVAFVGSKLYITSNTKGDSSSIDLQTPADFSAYTVLSLTAGKVTGKSAYDNTSFKVPYEALPATKTAVSNLVIDGDKVTLYRYFGNALLTLSKTSAVSWNSWSLGDTKWNNTDSGKGNQTQPVMVSRTKLVGVKAAGPKTAILFQPGQEASVTIPLGHNTGGVSGTTIWYPDVTSKNYLTVEAVGLQDYLLDNSAAPGSFIGTAGNAIKVIIKATPAVADVATWDGGAKTLTIDLQHATDRTFDQLKTCLNALTGITSAIRITLAYDSALGSAKAFGLRNLNTTPIEYYLRGGTDPVNFSTDNTADNTLNTASVMGCIDLNVGGELTGTDLGIIGETLEVSLNGNAYVKTTFDAGTSVKTLINTALAAASPAGSATLQSIALEEFDTGTTEITVNALRLTGSNAAKLHESTIQLKASTKVLEALFTGTTALTKTGIAHASDWDGRRSAAATTAACQPKASSAYEKAYVPGSVTVTLKALALSGGILLEPNALGLKNIDANVNLRIVHSAGGTVTLTLDHTTFNTEATAVADFVTQLNTQIAAGALANNVIARAITVNSKACVLICDQLGTGTIRLNVTGTDDTDGGAGANKLLKTALINGSTTTLFSDTVNQTSTSTGTSLTVKDTGSSNAPQVTAVSTMTPLAIASTIGFGSTNATHLTSLYLDLEVAATRTFIDYSAGNITIVLLGSAAGAGGKSLAAKMVASATLDVTATKLWPNPFGPTKPDYSRVFHAKSPPIVVGDSLWSAGSQMGKVVAIDTLSVGAGFAGAKLTLSELTIATGGTLTDWYVRAEALSSASTRAQPELVVDTTAQKLTIKHAVNRDTAGMAVTSGTAPVYAGYTALRLDVSSAAASPGLLVFKNTTEVESAIGPIVPENPLAFGLQKAFENAQGISITGLGIDEVTADAAYGTADSYGRAFDLLALKEVFTVAPMTFDRETHKLLDAHIDTMSAASGKKERVGAVCTSQPTEKEPTLVLSGTMTISAELGASTGKYELTFTDATKNIVTALNGKKDAGGNVLSISQGSTLLAEQGVWIDRAGDAFRYLVTKIVSATIVQVEVAYSFAPDSGPATEGNDDAYYMESLTALDDFSAAGETCTVYVRQAAIDASTGAGKLLVCEAMAGFSTGIGSKRVTHMQPDAYGCLVNGTEVSVPGFYACAAWAGMTGQQPAAQGFTNFPIVGFTRPIGSNDKFSEEQMATAAAGGVNWIIQDVSQGPVFSRHQLTTDVTSLKVREWSVTKAVDKVAKIIRSVMKPFIGKRNVDRQLLEEMGIAGSAACATVSGTDVAEAKISTLTVDAANPDTIAVDVTITPFYPANKIKIRLFI